MRRIPGLIAASLAAATTLPAPAAADTLADAIAAAYRANPRLLASRASERAAGAVLDQSRAAYGPSLTASASYAYTYVRQQIAAGLSAKEDGFAPGFAATLSQPLFTSGRLSAGVSSAKAGVGLARESLRQVEQDTISTVISAYVSVRRDEQLVAIARENADLLARQRSDTGERARVREATSTDLDQTENRYALAQAQLAEAEGQLQSSRAAYTAVVGTPPGVLEPEPPLPGLPSTVDEAYASAEAFNPTLLAAQYREIQSRAALTAARAQRGPTVAVEASAARNSNSPFNNLLRSDQVIGRGVVSLPLFSSGLISAQVRQAQASNDSDWRLVDQTRREVRQTVASAWERLNATRASLPPYARAVESAERAFAGAKEQERVGARATIEVLDQARDLLQSRTAYVQAQANAYLLGTTLLSAAGRLQIATMLPAEPRYDPAARRQPLAGIPLVSPALRAVDGVLNGDLSTPRPSRDAAVRMHAPASTPPLPPATTTAPALPTP